MARPLRLHVPGMLYHIVARGNDKQCIFEDDEDCRAFLVLLGETAERFAARCASYCLLWNHYHLLVKTGPLPISRLMQQLNSSYCGSDRLAALVAPLLKPLQETREHVYPERFATRPPLSALFEGCGRRCDVEEAAHIAFVDHAYTLEEIGRMVARDPSVVCRWVQCVRRRRRGAPSSSEDILARNKI